MGNSVLDGRASTLSGDGVITKFYTSAAWIEGRVEAQLEEVAGWTGVQKIAGFPDLHPGKYGPIGCAVLADRVFSQLIGNDIGCDMSLFQLDLPLRKLKLEKALRRMRALGEPASEDQGWRLGDAGLPTDLFATSLGTVGGGNHFCEVQTLAEAGDGRPKNRGETALKPSNFADRGWYWRSNETGLRFRGRILVMSARLREFGRQAEPDCQSAGSKLQHPASGPQWSPVSQPPTRTSTG